jgi:MFS family permease
MSPATDRSRWLALYVLCAGMVMVILDGTIVNVALPTIQDDLGFTQSSLAWVVNAYLIAFGGLLLLAGRLGDLISRRRVFLIGAGLVAAAIVVAVIVLERVTPAKEAEEAPGGEAAIAEAA